MRFFRLIVSNLSWFERLLLLSPFVDVLTGIAHHYNVAFLAYGSMIYRGGIVGLVLVLYFRAIGKNPKLKYLLMLCLTVVAANIVFVNTFIDTNNLLSNINSTLRFWFFPIVAICLIELTQQKIVTVSKYVVYYMAIIYAILLILPTLMGVHNTSYPDWTGKFGSAGLFYEGNEVGLILGLSAFGILYYVSQSRWTKATSAGIAVIVGGALLNGTKAPIMIFLLASTVYAAYWVLFKGRFNERIKRLIVLVCGLLLFTTGLAYLGYLYQQPYYKGRHIVNSFIFSSRLDYAQSRLGAYNEGSIAEKLIGTSQYSRSGEFVKHAEIDPVDMIYNFGIIGLSAYTITIVIILVPVLKRLASNSPLLFCRVGIITALVGSLVMGHVLSSPSVAIVPIIYILLCYSPRYKDLQRA